MRLEGQAICLFLEREGWGRDQVDGRERLLEFPRVMTGLDVR